MSATEVAPVQSAQSAQPPQAMRRFPLVIVTNHSTRPKTRWVTVGIPYGTGPKGNYATFGPGMIAVRGPAVAEHTQLWDVRCTVAGKQRTVLAGFREMPSVTDADMPGLGRWSDLIQGPKLVPTVYIEANGEVFAFRADQMGLLHLSAARARVAAFGMARGFHARIFANLWSGQDVIDLTRSAIIWSDPGSPQQRIRCKVWVEFGEPWQPYLASASGFSQVTGGKWLLFDGELLDGCGVTFRGVILPTDKTPATIEGWREDQENAAVEGPLTASCSEVLGSLPSPWDGNWLAGRAAPWEFRDSIDSRNEADALLAHVGNVTDARPLANELETGRTGSQPCFGATKDLLATSGDANRMLLLEWSADDYLLRGLIHYETNGAMVTAANHPNWKTWSGCAHESGSDTLGKSVSNRPWGWDTFASGRKIGVDDQHRGDLYIHCDYAMTGDELLREQLLHHLQTDKARAFRANRLAMPDPSDPRNMDWVDAPRAYGRMWQSWANAIVLLPDQRDFVVEMAMTELSFWRRRI